MKMADGFEQMVDAAVPFFGALAANNSKAWFEPQKARYIDEIRKPAEFMADLVAEDLARLTGKPHSPKVFRIYRDVRFSKDKTPLKSHLHVKWASADKDDLAPAWFFGLSPDRFFVGMGVTSLQGESLTRYRAFVDAWGDGLSDALDATLALGGQFSVWGPEPLKRVPKPYDQDHPHAELLKRKSLAISLPMPDDWRDKGLIKAVNTRIKDLLPVWEIFDTHL
jgi:uncharacterized protein (TIGR02453 family)